MKGKNKFLILITVIALSCPLGYVLAWGYFSTKIRQEKLLKFIKCLNFKKPSCTIFCAKLISYITDIRYYNILSQNLIKPLCTKLF